MKYFLTSVFIILGLALNANPNTDLNEFTIVGFAQGTSYKIKYYATQSIPKNAIDSILEVIDKSMSIYRDDSIISKFNQKQTRQVKMDEHMEAVILESFKTYKKTSGYFDITVMPLVNLWGFGNRKESKIPTSEEINKVSESVGMKYLKVNGEYLQKKKKNISIDVNGIAQGYTVDVLADFLEANGIQNFIVELGGEIVAKGQKPKGPFIVEIQRPYSNQKLKSYKIQLNNMAITSSGAYEKKREYNGKTISHHINPKTGYPIESNILSVTVIAKTAMKADAIDNFLMAMKPHQAISFVDNQKDMEAYIIYVENNIQKEIASLGFNNYLSYDQL